MQVSLCPQLWVSMYVHRDALYSGTSDEGSVLYVHCDALYSGTSDEGSVLYVHRDPLSSGSSDEGSVLCCYPLRNHDNVQSGGNGCR